MEQFDDVPEIARRCHREGKGGGLGKCGANMAQVVAEMSGTQERAPFDRPALMGP